MNKKLLMLIALTTLLLGVAFVYASMTSTSSTDGNKINYNVQISLTKGWNLVVGTPVWGSEQGAITSNSEIQKDNIKASFYYFRYENKYLQLYPNSGEVDGYLRNAQEKPDEALYFVQSPVWIYSDQTGTLNYTREDFPNPSYPALSAGWNFITITPDFIGKNLNELNGNCNLERVYFWSNPAQRWFEFSKSEVIDGEYEGTGLVVKVSSDCQLGSGSSEITSPPAIP